jgi:CMP-N-acetylneuraminic acid synthetase
MFSERNDTMLAGDDKGALLPMRVAGLLPIRTQSVRCKNKALRPFGATTLTRLALEKFSRSEACDTLYFAAHEEELIAVARDFPRVRIIRRSRASAFGEDAVTIYDFMREIEEPVIASLNACCAFLRIETFDRAIREYVAKGYRSIMPVVATQEWYFDAGGRPLGVGDNAVINTKQLPVIYRASHPFQVYNRESFLRDYRIWHLEPDDPHLFEIPEDEALDIDTELQFELAQALYVSRRGIW